RVNHFEGHRAVLPAIAREIDGRHAAPSDRALDLIVAELRQRLGSVLAHPVGGMIWKQGSTATRERSRSATLGPPGNPLPGSLVTQGGELSDARSAVASASDYFFGGFIAASAARNWSRGILRYSENSPAPASHSPPSIVTQSPV